MATSPASKVFVGTRDHVFAVEFKSWKTRPDLTPF